MNPRPDSKEAVAERLKLLRLVVSGENQTSFAASLNIEVKRWNNMERGYSPLSKEVALLIVKKYPDFTLDWLFLARRDGLTLKRQRELDQAAFSLRGPGPSGDRPSPRHR